MLWFKTQSPPLALIQSGLTCLYVARPRGEGVAKIALSVSLLSRIRLLQKHAPVPIDLEHASWFDRDAARLVQGLIADRLVHVREDWFSASSQEITDGLDQIKDSTLITSFSHEHIIREFGSY